ncbi:unnamed protein product [Somion occarium]|uniref:Uncharacterized protein n=1 Tax=Somion occarium TaxID=3059160 RepID=A0ABP1DVE3_9APHY
MSSTYATPWSFPLSTVVHAPLKLLKPLQWFKALIVIVAAAFERNPLFCSPLHFVTAWMFRSYIGVPTILVPHLHPLGLRRILPVFGGLFVPLWISLLLESLRCYSFTQIDWWLIGRMRSPKVRRLRGSRSQGLDTAKLVSRSPVWWFSYGPQVERPQGSRAASATSGKHIAHPHTITLTVISNHARIAIIDHQITVDNTSELNLGPPPPPF